MKLRRLVFVLTIWTWIFLSQFQLGFCETRIQIDQHDESVSEEEEVVIFSPVINTTTPITSTFYGTDFVGINSSTGYETTYPSTTTENEIPVFNTTTTDTRSGTTTTNNNNDVGDGDVDGGHKKFRLKGHENREFKRKRRLLKFLRHFRLDFSKFDGTCLKRSGRWLPAPHVTNARVTKYTKRRNRSKPRNRYATALYKCDVGYEFPSESADRMFCSRSKWVGPTPVCISKGSLARDLDCSQCEQMCSTDPGSESGVRCSCYLGYEMVNDTSSTCVDIDECSTDNGGCSGICVNKPGFFQCFCPTGFQLGPDGKQCLDRNECLLRNGHGPCQGSCENTAGSYICRCDELNGTRLSPDKRTCQDINECVELDNFGCSHICINTFGNAFCACPKGYTLSQLDFKTCQLPDDDHDHDREHTNTVNDLENEIEDEKVKSEILNSIVDEVEHEEEIEEEEKRYEENIAEEKEHFEEINDEKSGNVEKYDELSPLPPPQSHPQSLKWQQKSIKTSAVVNCPPGSTPDFENPRICVEHEDCSLDNGGCEHNCVPSGSFRFCSCRPGYELVNETACQIIDICKIDNGGCDHQCNNIPGSPIFCTCKDGFILDEDRTSCKSKEDLSCEEPPTLPNSSGWECELLPGDESKELNDNEKITFSQGTVCKIKCQLGYDLILPQQQTPQHHQNSIQTFNLYNLVDNEGDIDSVLPPPILIAPPESSDRNVNNRQRRHLTDRIFCTSEGTWSPPDILKFSPCIFSSCSRLPEIENGSLFPESCFSEFVPLNTQCLVLCSPGYYPKNGRIRTCSKGYRWFPEESPHCVQLPPTPRPYIHCPSDVEVELKPGLSSSHVKIPQPQANMDWYRYVEAEPHWAKNLEWDVPAGVTQIVFTARSPVTNDTASCQFKIHVVDREAPKVGGCPTSFEVGLSAGETSREVWWSEPRFSDNVRLHYVQQSHSPGQPLTLGQHHVTYTAGDSEGNKARCSFTITIHDPSGNDEINYEMSDYSHLYPRTLLQHQQLQNQPSNPRHMIICPNLKTGRWTLHYAYYLPSGCRYHSQGLFSKLFKLNTYRHFVPRLRRRRISSRHF